LQALRFQDADFQHRFAWCSSPLEGRSLRWIPFGMPRLNPTFKRSVFFLYGINPETGKRYGPNGSGFLIGVPFKTHWWYRSHIYAITCQHVAPRGHSIIRINTNDSASRFIDVHPDDWQWIPGHDDVAAVDITERIDLEKDNVSLIPSQLLVTRKFATYEELEIGEDGFMLGLFAEVPGRVRNLVAARFGNVSLLADDETPIKQPNENLRPSHIFDMRSRPGFSGSPVFIYRTPAGDLRSATERGRDKTFRRDAWRDHNLGSTSPFEDLETHQNTFLMLLGLHAGQYHDTVKAKKVKRAHAENDDIMRDGDQMRIPNSMAIVVPSWEIWTLLDQPFFEEQRKAREERMTPEENAAEPESNGPAADAPPPANGENPTHREDFMRLVNAAARKPEPKG
jgi:hypothetical protein